MTGHAFFRAVLLLSGAGVGVGAGAGHTGTLALKDYLLPGAECSCLVLRCQRQRQGARAPNKKDQHGPGSILARPACMCAS